MPRSARTLAVATVLSIAAPCFGQATAAKDVADICQRVLCRDPATVRVVLKDGSVKEMPSRAANPVVLADGAITVRQGEQVHIAVDLQGETVRGVRAMKLPTDAGDALSLRLRQDPTTRDSLLVVENGSDRMLKLDLGVVAPEGDRMGKTIACPVGAGKSLYQQWPQPVFQVVVTRIQVLPAGSATACQ
jgi:hypothetical protein